MKRWWTLTLAEFQQPDAAAWQHIARFAEAWNENHYPQFGETLPGLLEAVFEDTTKPVLDALLKRINSDIGDGNVAYHITPRTELEDEDFESAGFVEILGMDLGEENHPFVLNESEMMGPSSVCPECGWEFEASWTQPQPAVIDEAQLDAPFDGEDLPRRGGWDFVNLPNDGLLISRRVANLLGKKRAQGNELREVIDGASGRTSSRMVQLAASRRVLVPCTEHSKVVGDPHCPVCGTAYGYVDGYYWVRDTWVDSAEVIARHPSYTGALFFSRRIYEILESARLNGIHRKEALFICHHQDGEERE